MPQTWHCVAPIVYQPRRCDPFEVAPAKVPPVSVPAPVGGSVPATLALSVAGTATFGAFTAGLAKEYTASTTANVISTALDATLTVSEPGHLMNGTFALPEPLRVELSKSTWAAPVSNEPVSIAFKQTVKATDALRTGAYSKTLTFTLSTTNP
jgi:amidase